MSMVEEQPPASAAAASSAGDALAPASNDVLPIPPLPPSPAPRATPPAIRTRGLTKIYGQLVALDRLDLELESGDVFGFIGPNGAGKSTAMKILSGLLAP